MEMTRRQAILPSAPSRSRTRAICKWRVSNRQATSPSRDGDKTAPRNFGSRIDPLEAVGADKLFGSLRTPASRGIFAQRNPRVVGPRIEHALHDFPRHAHELIARK